MEKLTISQSQFKGIQKLLSEGEKNNKTEIETKAVIVDTHQKKGWSAINDKDIQELEKLTLEEMLTVLFSNNYEVERIKLAYQEYEVSFLLNQSTRVVCKVYRKDDFQLEKEEVIESALNRLKKMDSYFEKLTVDSLDEYKVISIQQEKQEG